VHDYVLEEFVKKQEHPDFYIYFQGVRGVAVQMQDKVPGMIPADELFERGRNANIAEKIYGVASGGTLVTTGLQSWTAGKIVGQYTGHNSPAPSNKEYLDIGKKLRTGGGLSNRMKGVAAAGGPLLLFMAIGTIIHRYRTDMEDEMERRKELGVFSKEQVKREYTDKLEYLGIKEVAFPTPSANDDNSNNALRTGCN